MSKLKSIIISFMALIGLAALPVPVFAAASCNGTPVECAQAGVKGAGSTDEGDQKLKDGIKTIVNVMLFLLGAIAVIMIVIGGIRYTTSNGDASATKGAKDTILYAVIGLVVAILAYAIVSFILG